MEAPKVDYKQMEADLREHLENCEESSTPVSFTSFKDESAFFPEVEGWELVMRSSRFVPAHYVNDAQYVRKDGMVVAEEPKNEEAQPEDV